MLSINLITGNQNKVKEIKDILDSDFNIVVRNLNLPEIQGEPEDIAREKCKMAYNQLNEPVIVEDTSIGFDALNGLPGPYIKDFVEKLGCEGIVKLLDGFENKNVTGKSICAYCFNKEEGIKLFTGESYGKIVPPSGRKHGLDQIFLPNGYDKTYGDLEPGIKSKISHRYISVGKLKQYLIHKK